MKNYTLQEVLKQNVLYVDEEFNITSTDLEINLMDLKTLNKLDTILSVYLYDLKAIFYDEHLNNIRDLRDKISHLAFMKKGLKNYE